MRALRWALALLMLIGLGSAANGAEVSVPSSPTRWATDTGGFLRPQTVVALDERLRAYENTTGHQILVYVAPTTGSTPTEDWTVRAFARWKVGRKGLDDGLVLFVFPTDRKVRIEVGYGLEQTVPDAVAARIIRDTITPKLRDGQPDEAVTAGVEDILAAVGGEAARKGNASQGKVGGAPIASAPRAPEPYTAPDSGGSGDRVGQVIGILIGILVSIGVIVLIAKLPTPKGSYISSRRSSGFGFFDALGLVGGLAGGLSGGGGFSGGGGSSGGGGATGSW